MGCIYMIQNTENGKAYVGQTRNPTPEKRILSHLFGITYFQNQWHYQKDSERNRGILADIEQYGIDAFQWSIVYENVPQRFLNIAEVQAIKDYRTLQPYGYNIHPGTREANDIVDICSIWNEFLERQENITHIGTTVVEEADDDIVWDYYRLLDDPDEYYRIYYG